MQSRMLPKYYLSQTIFELEQKKIFSKLWLFAGIRQMLPQHNSFLTRTIAGIPVVVQNFNGKIRAFENTCLHRSAKIQWESFGRRPLLCRYHGWGYASDGTVQNIPFEKEIYQFPTEARKCLKLREFAVEVVGGIIFVNLAEKPILITEQFSIEFLETLASSSNAYDTEVMYTIWHGDFNWKLAYENLRDANHVRFVHAQSLAKSVSFPVGCDPVLSAEANDPLPRLPSNVLMHKELRRFSFGGIDAPIENMPQFGWYDFIERWGNTDAYYNWLAYPNLHIASGNGGYSFTIEHHVPISPSETSIEIYYFTARKRKQYGYSNQVLLSHMHGSKLVVGEDVKIMEMVQSGLHINSPIAQQGEYEAFNRIIEKWYQEVIESSNEYF